MACLGIGLMTVGFVNRTCQAEETLYAPMPTAQIRARLDALVDAQAGDDALKATIAEVWQQVGDSASATDRFDATMQSLYLLDEDVRVLVDACLGAAPRRAQDFGVLQDGERDPFVTQQSRLFYARYLSVLTLYDEALGLFDERPDDGASPLVVALGERLFFSGVLSEDESVSCSSCHDPAHGFADPRSLSEGVGGARTLRHAPALINRGFGRSFMWDGSIATLEDQVLQPVANPLEMNLPLEVMVARLNADATWSDAFEEAFGRAPRQADAATALAAYVRRLHHGDTPVDAFRMRNDRTALSVSERAGFWFWESRGQCWRCHSGPNFTDEAFHATGVGARDGVPEEGRFAVTGDEADRGKFKTPTLRGLAFTAPYMHDGSLATLEDVVEFYRRGGVPHSHLSPDIRPIDMTDEDAKNLAAFLRALSRRAQEPDGR